MALQLLFWYQHLPYGDSDFKKKTNLVYARYQDEWKSNKSWFEIAIYEEKESGDVIS